MEMSNPHDRLFKQTWSDQQTARSFLQHYLPCDLLPLIDIDKLEVCTESFVDENMREYRCDMLYRTAIAGRSGYLYFLFEHKSYADPDIALQLLTYMSRIWQLHRKQENATGPLPAIVPLVLYHGREPWKSGESLIDRFESPPATLVPYIPDFRFVLIDLSRYSDAQIRGEVTLQAALLLFKYVFTPEYEDRLPGIFALLKSLVEKTTGMQYIEAIIRYVLSTLEGVDTGTLKTVVEQSLSKDQGDLVMTIADVLFNQGFQKGIQQGIEQGIQQGIQKGIQQGIQKGIQQGIQKGHQQGLREGIQKGLIDGIELALELKFGSKAKSVMAAVGKLNDVDRLMAVRDAIRIGATLQDIEEMISAPQA